MTEFEHRLNRLMAEAISELKRVGIAPSKNISSISVNKRAKKRLGCCKYEKSGGKVQYRLEISSMLEEKDDRTIKEVILHELLHTCPGCLNHGEKWKAMAALVNRTYGYSISTTADYRALEIDMPERAKYKYEIVCTKCGKTGYRMKKSKVILHPEKYRCSSCGGALKIYEILGK